MSQTVRLVQDSFGYYHVHIGLVEGDEVTFPASAGVYGDEPQCHGCASMRLRVGRDGISGRVVAAGEPILVPDVSRDPRFIPLQEGQTGSSLVLPLRVRGEVIGVLDVESDRLSAFDESDVVVLQSLADQVAVAVENARLYEQAQRLAALEERQRLARELHDSVSQALYGIGLGARTARALLDRDPAQASEPLEYVLSLADAGLAEMRALIFELRPDSLEREGLVAALTKQTAALQGRHNLEVHTEFPEEPALPIEVKEALYRIAQEALNNAIKHARARRVAVRLEGGARTILLEVQDDGLGFDPLAEYPGHLGLRTMQERTARLGGTLELESEPGRGTRLRARIPLRDSS